MPALTAYRRRPGDPDFEDDPSSYVIAGDEMPSQIDNREEEPSPLATNRFPADNAIDRGSAQAPPAPPAPEPPAPDMTPSVPTVRQPKPPSAMDRANKLAANPPAPPRSGVLKTVGTALLSRAWGPEAANAVMHPRYSAERQQYEQQLADAETGAKLENTQQSTASLVAQREASAAAKKATETHQKAEDTERNRADLEREKAKKDANQLAIFKELANGRKVAYHEGDEPPYPGYVKLPTTPPGMEKFSAFVPGSGVVTEELVKAGVVPPGLKVGDVMPPNVEEPALKAYYAIAEAKAKADQKPYTPNEGHFIHTINDPKSTPEEAAIAKKDLAMWKQSHPTPAGPAVDRDLIKAAIESAAQSLAAGDLTRIRDISGMRGDQRLALFARAREINPKFNTSEIDRMIKMEDNMTNGKDGVSLQSFGTFLEHAGEASEAVNSIRQSGSPIINRPINWWRQNASGDPAFQAFQVSLEPVRKEFEGFLLGGRALYGDDRRAAEVILNDNSSPAQIQAALKQMGKTAKARFSEMNFRYKKLMKKDIPEPFSPEAIAGASRIGVDLNTAGNEPGVITTPDGKRWKAQGGKMVELPPRTN